MTFFFLDGYAKTSIHFDCPKCEKQYKRRSNLMFHLKYECGVEPKFKCVTCSRQFKQKQSLKRHNIMIHKLLIL